MVGETLGHYEILEPLGAGGMGEVYRARDTRLDRDVAIKVLPADVEHDAARLAQFETEAKIVAALNHPNIVTIYSIEDAGDRRFITMELVEGKNLDDLVPTAGLPLETFYGLAISLADALSAAHQRGVTHGDLKPGNVIVSADEVVKILDFGLARLREPDTMPDLSELTTETVSLEQRISGTLPYVPPERFQGAPPDEHADIFALGVMLYEMVTGRRPFEGTSIGQLVASILRDAPVAVNELNSELPRHLARVIGRCLDKEPERRLQTALDLRNELEALQRETGRIREEAVPSIAVLPFTDMSAEKDQDYFCEGLAEEIINALTRVDDLRVASRTSSFRFKGTPFDGREIGDRLAVSTLLDGTVRKDGDRLRVTVDLTSVADGYQLWSERYDRKLEDVFAIQDEIAQSVVGALELTLSPRERRAIKHVATADALAYDYYLRGRKFYYRFRRRDTEFALQMFSRAIDLDSSYALAHAGIADCYSFLWLSIDRLEEHRREADAASRRALELDPDLAEAHVSRGLSLSIAGRHAEAEEAFDTAIRLNPRLFEAFFFYARDCFVQGDLAKAIRLYGQAAEIRPDDYQTPLLVAQIHADLGDEESARQLRRAGVAVAGERLDWTPDDVRALYMGANGLVALGDREKGLSWAQRALQLAPDEPMVLYNIACIYSLAEQPSEAVAYLENALDVGFVHRDWIEHDSNLDAARDHPDFQSLLGRLT